MPGTKWSNQHKRSRNAYPPRGGLLDNGQKARIAILARQAFDRLGATARPASDFEDWRHEQQFLAVGKESMRDCLQADFKKLEGWFLNLAGEPGRAVDKFIEDQLSEKEIAMNRLTASLQERGLHVSYAETICRGHTRGQRGLDSASAGEIWRVLFTVRNRRKAVPRAHARDRAPDRICESEDPF